MSAERVPGNNGDPWSETRAAARGPETRLRWLQPGPAFQVLFVILIGLFLFLVIRGLLAPTVLAAAAAVLLSPLHRRLERKFGETSNRAALISMLAVALFAGLPLLGAAILFVSQARIVLDEFLGMPASTALTTGLSRLVDQYLEWIEQIGGRYLGPSVNVRQVAQDRLQELGSGAYEALPGLLEWALQLGFGFVVFNVVLYFLLRDGRQVLSLLRKISPLASRHTDKILYRLAQILRAVFLGGVLTALFQASVGAVGFLLTGFESFVIWGVFLFVASFIPVLGTALVWAPAVLFLAFTGDGGRALVLLAFGLFISTIDNFLRLILIGHQAALNPLVLFLAVFGGLATGGPMGLVYGILLAAALTQATEIYCEEHRPEAEPPPVAPPRPAADSEQSAAGD